MDWYLEVLRKYAQFDGRARRKEYWFYMLFNIIVSAVLGVVDFFIGAFDMESGVGLLSGLYSLAVLIPSLAVLVRRLHDTGRSAWWLLVGLLPVIGSLILLFFIVQDSKPDNQYGKNPKLGANKAF